MTTVSFKAEEELKLKLDTLAQKKGINTSAYIKLVLTKTVQDELGEVTENGLTVAEELAIQDIDSKGKVHGPYSTTASLMRALKK